MKKKIVLLTALAAAGLSTVTLASCNEPKNDNTDPTTTEEESTTDESTTEVDPETLEKSAAVSGCPEEVIYGTSVEAAFSGIKVTATLEDGTKKDVTEKATIDTSKVDTSKVGTYEVKVSYVNSKAGINVSETYTVTVRAKETGVKLEGYVSNVIIGTDVKKTYEDLKVIATLNDGTTKDVTDLATIDASKVDTSKAGAYVVYVHYKNSTDGLNQLSSFIVNVKDYTLESISATQESINLPLYSELELNDVDIKGTYKNPIDGTTHEDTISFEDCGYTLTDSEGKVVKQLENVGDYALTVTYEGKTCTITVVCINPTAPTTVSGAVAQAVTSDSTVNSGVYTHISNGYYSYTEKNTYEIGENFTKQHVEANYTDKTTYFSLDNKGNAFAVSDEDGYVSKYYDDHQASIYDSLAVGFDIFSVGGTEYPEYGFAEVIADLYSRYATTYSDATHVTKKESITTTDGVTTYHFEFNDVSNSSGAAHFSHYSVSFVLNEQGAIASANVLVSTYEADDYVEYDDLKTADYTLPESLGLTLVRGQAEGGGEVYSFTINDGTTAASTDTYKVTQTSGMKAKADTNPYSFEKVAVSSFDVKVKFEDSEDYEEFDESTTYKKDLDFGNSFASDDSRRFEFNIKIENVGPETANTDLDTFSVVVTGTAKDGKVVDSTDWPAPTAYTSVGNVYDDEWNTVKGEYVLRFGRAGSYSVTISTLGVTKTYTFEIADEAPSTITPVVQDGEADTDFAQVDEVSCYTTNSLYLDCQIAKYYTQGYSVSVLKVNEDGSAAATDKATVKKGTYTVNGKNVKCYKFNATEAGDYKLVFTGAKPDDTTRDAALAEVLVHVSAVPSCDDIVKGEHNYLFETTVSASEMYKVSFTAPNASGEGTYQIWNKYDSTKTQVGTYTYSNGTFVLDTTKNDLGLADNAEFEFELTGYYKLKLKNSVTEKTYLLGAPTSDITDSELALLKGSYEVTSGDTTIAVKFTPSTAVKGDGVVSVTVGSASAVSYNYTYNCTTDSLELSGNDTAFEGTIKISNGKLVYVAKDSTAEVEFVSTSIPLDKFLAGTWTGNVGGRDCKFVFTVNDDNETGIVDITSGSRNGKFNFTFDETSGKITLTYVSGQQAKKLYVEEFELTDENLYANYSQYNYHVLCSKEGSSETEKVEIPESVQGTWYCTSNDNDYTVTITSTTVTYVNDDEESDTATYTLKSYKDGVATLVYGNWDLTLTITSDSVSIDDGNMVKGTLSKTKAVKVPAGYDGTWRGKDENGNEYSVVLSEGSTTVIVTAFEDTYTFNIVSYSNGQLAVKYVDDYNTSYTYTIILGNNTVSIYDDWHKKTITLSQGSTTTIEFDEDYIGTWSGSNNDSSYILVVYSDSLTLNDSKASDISSSQDDVYTFIVDGQKYDLVIDNTTLSIRKYKDGVLDTTSTVTLTKAAVYTVDVDGIETIVTLTKTSVIVEDDSTYTIDTEKSTEETIIAKDKDAQEYQVKLTLVDGVVTKFYKTSDSGEHWEEYTDIKEGSASEDTDVTVTDEYIGTWKAEDGSEVVITKTTITYGKKEYTLITTEDDDLGFKALNAREIEVTYSLYVEGSTLTISNYGDRSTYTKVEE